MSFLTASFQNSEPKLTKFVWTFKIPGKSRRQFSNSRELTAFNAGEFLGWRIPGNWWVTAVTDEREFPVATHDRRRTQRRRLWLVFLARRI